MIIAVRETKNEAELLAAALLEIRILLGDCLGSVNDAPPKTRIAAHLAYALHNEAETIHEGPGRCERCSRQDIGA